MSEQKVWSVVELLKTSAGFFLEKKVAEPRLSAELLLGHVLGLKRIDLYLNFERPVSPTELDAFRVLCQERLRRRPVQYLIGEQYFFGYRFAVDEQVLIPRPETELVVEHALDRFAACRLPGEAASRILDIGTGSGCIAVTLALKLPEAVLTAIDVSPAALRVAQLNAAAHGVAERIRFLQADLFDDSFAPMAGFGYEMIVSNPPYIPGREWSGLQDEVRLHEPRIALVAPEGFEYYREIVSRASSMLRQGGILCFELHADAAEVVTSLMAPLFEEIRLTRDYSGLDRVLSGMLRRSA